MNDILNKSIVLVLNRNWQAVNIRKPQEAFCMMATNVATALEIELDNEAGEASRHPSRIGHQAGDEVLLVLDPGLEEAITAYFAPNGQLA